ncbi:MAG: sensor histidine kinase [Candidatus Neoclostridium sp.]
MTKKMRIRFIVLSMLVLLIMQGLIIFFSAQNSYSNIVVKSDRLIDTIKSAYPESANVDARYFVVTVSRDGGEKQVDLSHISSVKYEKAMEYAKAVLGGDSDKGFSDAFRYRVFRDADGITIVFLSRSLSFDALKSSVFSSVLFSCIGMGVMLIILFAASFWVTRPVTIANKKQRQFITSASHELGTPLTVIKADAAILLSDDPDNEWLRDIDKQTARLTAMTHNLIALSKMDEQGKRVKAIDFPVSDVAKDVVRSYRAVAESENRSFVARITENITYKGDENLIRQLFTILLDNAFKYCPTDGKIDFRLDKTPQGISVCVTNTTEHIEKDQLQRIFDRFYRSDNAASSGKKGHGLGLSIAESVVKMHRGKIFAKSPDDETIEITAVLR